MFKPGDILQDKYSLSVIIQVISPGLAETKDYIIEYLTDGDIFLTGAIITYSENDLMHYWKLIPKTTKIWRELNG